MAALFFAEMRFDPKDPHNPDSDRFVLSKGHAAPILYAAWAEAGAFDRARAAEAAAARLRSRRPPDAAAAVRRRRHRLARPGHLRRDRHRAQRAPDQVRLPHLRAARRRRIGRRIGVGSGRRRRRSTSSTTCAPSPTSTRSARAGRRCGSTTWSSSRAAGARSAGTRSSSTATTWRRSSTRFDEARRDQGPADDDPGAHDQGQRRLVRRRQGRLARQGVQEGRRARSRARRAREAVRAGGRQRRRTSPAQIPKPASRRAARTPPKPLAPPAYKLGDQVATREAYGTALAKLGDADRARRRARRRREELDVQRQVREGAPDRFYENFIAEQVMVGAAMGLAARGAIPFPSTFACFLTRAADFIRMAAISNSTSSWPARTPACRSAKTGRRRWRSRIWRCAARSRTITVLYPCDAVSTERLVGADGVSPGPGVHPDEPAEDAGDLRQRRDVRDRRAEGAARERARRGDGRRRRRDAVRGAEGVRSAEGGRHRDPRHRSVFGRSRSIATGSIAAGARDRRPHHHGRGSLRRRRHRRRGRRSGGGRRLHRAPARRARDSAQRQAGRAARSLRHLRERTSSRPCSSRTA